MIADRRRRELVAGLGLITFVALISYAPLITGFGFYRDDWYQLWAGETLGASSIITLFSIDRPAMGYLYAAAFRLLGTSPLAWQVYSLVLRWLGAVATLWLLRRIWPDRPWATLSTTVLMLAYPGFLQQPNANTFSNHLFGYTSAIVSLAATVESFHRPAAQGRILVAVALLGAFGSWLTYEYMIGLEAVRYLLLVRHGFASRAGRSGVPWSSMARMALPYLAPLVLFLTFRLVFFQAGRGSVNVVSVLAAYSASPGEEISRRAIELGKDFIEAVVLGWAVPAYTLFASASPQVVLAGALLGGLATAAYLAYARSVGDPNDLPASSSASYREHVWLGVLAVVAATAPVVLTGRDIRWSSAFDRYTLHATLGIGLVVAGAAFHVLRPTARMWTIGALLGLSVFSHHGNAVAWGRFWSEQRTLWWQLSWRAPDLEPGTVLLVTLPSQRYFEDYEVWGPANLIYAPGQRQPPIASEVVEELTAVKARQGLEETRGMRVLITIPRDYKRLLVAGWSAPDSCVHVFDRDQLEPSANDSSLLLSLGGLSDVGRIRTTATPVTPPQRIFGREPERGWCWYYQAASLARQRADWPRVVELGDQAASLGLTPLDASEWMPFFHGYVNLGQERPARRIASTLRQDPLVAQSLCDHLTDRHFEDEAASALGRSLLCDE